jgi:hypothetical protein
LRRMHLNICVIFHMLLQSSIAWLLPFCF